MVDRDVQEDQLLAGDVRGIGQRSLGCVRSIDRNDDPVERCGCSGWGFGSHDDLLPLPGPEASLPWSCLFDPGESRARGMYLLCILYAIWRREWDNACYRLSIQKNHKRTIGGQYGHRSGSRKRLSGRKTVSRAVFRQSSVILVA